MMAQLSLISHIEHLCTILNAEFSVQPHLRIVFGGDDINGACNVLYHRKKMYIAIYLPWKYTYTEKTKNLLTCLLTHEFAHYLWSLKLSSEERVVDTRKYLNSKKFKRLDEYRTWKCTAKILKSMGWWNAEIRRSCLSFVYSWRVKDE